MQHMSATDSVTVHHGNDRLRQTTDLHLHVEHTQTGYTFLVHITASSLDVHIASRAEGVLHVIDRLALRHRRHRSRQQHHTDVLHLTALCESLTQLPRCLRRKRVTILRPVDSNLRYAVICLEENLLERPNSFPVSCFHF